MLKAACKHHCLPILLISLAILSACSFPDSEPDLSFSDNFISDHNFTVALNATSDGLDISFAPQDNASYALTRSSAKRCSSASSESICADYIEFEITEDGYHTDSLPERTYYYKLSVSMAGVNETLAAQYPPLDPPSSVAADAGDKQLTLTWQNVAGASSYDLYGARVSGVTPENYATLEGGFREQGVTSPYTLINLLNGFTYYMVLTAVNADGIKSTYSAEVNATPVAVPSDNLVPELISASAVTTAENSTGTFYTASASDANGDSISYSILGGEDHKLFTIGASSGALSFLSSPDYENPSDSNRDNFYQLSLIASDGTDSSAALTLTVSVSDLSELQVDYNLSADEVAISYDLNFEPPEDTTITLYRADEPIGTSTCSALDGIDACADGVSWSGAAFPGTDSIDWSARRYYQLDVSVDDIVIERLSTDLAVSDYLTMNEPTVTDNGYTFDLSWQALPNIDSYKLYLSTDANATSATEASWTSLEGAQIIDNITDANYSLEPNRATSLYVALTAGNASGESTDLSQLNLIGTIEYEIDDGSNWWQATASAGWSGRYEHTSVVFDNKLWVIGGNDGSREDDVWYSEDGVNWTQATDNAGWSGRSAHTSVVFDDKLWVIGGLDGSNDLNDAWYSEDGVNWTQATSDAGWSERRYHSSVVFDDKLWVIGGYSGNREDDVWYSHNGVNWTRATGSAEWSGRYGHVGIVFRGMLWVIGGYSGIREDDIWYSHNGASWTRATSRSGWSGRTGHASVVFDGKIWVLGGSDGSREDDVWYSSDGVNWTQATSSAGWSGRYGHTSIVFDDRLWVLGGYDGNQTNDIWYSSSTINSFAFNSINYDYQPPQNQAPTFTSATSAIAEENSLAAYTASGNDPDGGRLAFSIAGGADAELFTISSSSGELSFVEAPNYEDPADSDADNTYELTLGISDGSADGADLSVTITVINEVELPIAPVIVQALARDSSVFLSWQAVDDANSYRVYRDTDGNPSISQHLANQEVSENSADIFDLNNDTIYYFVITALNELGESAESIVLSLKPQSGGTNEAPTAEAGSEQTVSEGATVYLSGRASDADGSVVRYDWSSTSSELTIINSDNSNGNANFIAPEVDAPGDTITLTLIVTDDDDASGSDTVAIIVENNEAPTVSVGGAQSTAAGSTISLSGSASDADGTVVAYLWQETSASIIESGGVSIDRADNTTANFAIPTDLTAGTNLTFEFSATDDDGASASAQANVTIVAGGSLKWSFAAGDKIYSSPALALDGKIYFGSDDGKLYALNPDGSADWNYTTGDKVRSAPTLDANGTIYFGSDDGKLYSLDSNGGERWSYTTGAMVRSSPAIGTNGKIYFGSADGKLYALDANGSEDWNYSTSNAIHSPPTVSAEGMIYFGDSAGMVYELNSFGELQRSFDSFGAIYTAIALDPANQQLYFSNRNGNIYALSTDSSISWNSPLWSFAANNLDSAPVVAEDGTIYIGSYDDARLYALAADGSILSSKFYSDAGAINATASLGANSRIYFSSGDGYLYALDASDTTTMLDWQYDIGWSYASGAPAASAPALASDGAVYVGSTDGKLYALYSASAGLADSSWPRFAHDNQNIGRINVTPRAEAGADQQTSAGAVVVLDGSGSSDPDGAVIDYYWQETSGYGVNILDNNSSQASFTAPTNLSTNSILTIELTVTDNSGASASDTLEVEVQLGSTQ